MSTSRITPPAGLGEPPQYLDAKDRECWRELSDDCPPWLLRRSDAPAAELLCRLWSRSRRGWLKVGEEALLVRLLRCFGMTPAARAARWYRELEAEALVPEREPGRQGATVAAGEHAVRLSLTRGRARRRGSPS